MRGKVNARNEAILTIRVSGQGRMRRKFFAVIDTGYSGSLTLPRKIIRALKLPYVATSNAQLADGKLVKSDVYVGLVEWNGRQRPIDIDEAETTPLIGMALLGGHRVTIDVWQNGRVTIKKRAKRRA